MKRMPRNLIAAIVCLFIALPAAAAPVDRMPAKLSAANGWHGLQLRQGGATCGITFPKEFGAKPLELQFLEKIAEHDEKFNDFQCGLDPYAPLDQIKRVAVEQQNAAAARLMLYAPETGKLDLDGEVAETYANSYQTPLLMGYNDLKRLVPPAKQARVAQDVCVGMFFGDTDETPDLDALLARLKAMHMDAFAARVKAECDQQGKDAGADNAPKQ